MKKLLLALLILVAPSWGQFGNASKFQGFPIVKPAAADDGKTYTVDWTNHRFVLTATSGSGTVTSVIIAGTANQITAAGTCTIVAAGTCTLSLPSALIIPGTINGLTITSTTSGVLTIANSSTLATSGANSITLTSTGTTNVTLPTSGTLVNTVVTTLSSLVSISTITTGVWHGTAVTEAYGGTGQTSYTKGDLLCASGATTFTKLGVGADALILTADAASTCGVKWAAGGGGSSYSAGNGLTLTSTTFSINTTITMDLPSAQVVAGVKSFNANTLILTPGADSGTTAGMVNIDASGNLDWYSSGRIYAMRNPLTTAGDLIYSSNTATPGVPARLAIGAAGSFLYTTGSAPSWRIPLASDVTNAFDVTLANTLTAVSAPGTPASGFLAVYYKTGSSLCVKNSSGTETCGLGAGGGSTSGSAMLFGDGAGGFANLPNSSIVNTNGILITSDPAASATQALLTYGAAIASGSGSGTYFGINADAGYGGEFVNWQVNGAYAFRVGATGYIFVNGADGGLYVQETGGGNRVSAYTQDAKPHHFVSTFGSTGAAPGVSGCTASIASTSSDGAGKVTSGTTGTCTVTVTFNRAYVNAPACMANNETTANLARAISTTTTVVISGVTVSGDVIPYICIGSQSSF